MLFQLAEEDPEIQERLEGEKVREPAGDDRGC